MSEGQTVAAMVAANRGLDETEAVGVAAPGERQERVAGMDLDG